MTDGARLKRLTELARRVWTSRRNVRVVHESANDITVVLHEVGFATLPLVSIPHPRGLDGLEALLHALVGDDWTIEESWRRVEAARGHPPAWIEELAEEWEIKARMLAERCITRLRGNTDADLLSDIITNLVDSLARELREKARRP